MKNFYLALLSILVLNCAASAASHSITNLSNPTFTAILDTSGTAITSGVVVLGSYTSEPVSANNILTNFIQAGTGSIGFFGSGAPGYFTGNINSNNLGVGEPLVGMTVYALIGNGATIATSTQVAVWKSITNPSGNIFVADNPTGGPSDVAVFASTGSLIIGNVQANFDGGLGPQNAFRLEAIPEPSTLLLASLGVLGLLRRRR
jgi:hypothetical protein